MIPYSVNLSGGGLDQVYLNKFVPGWNITISIEPTYNYLERAGMATSTRNTAMKLWKDLPVGDEKKLAWELFKAENKGKKYVSGFQDSAGIMIKGITACWYDNGYCPRTIETTTDKETVKWLEKSIQMFEVGQREEDFNLFKNKDLNKYSAQRLADASYDAYFAICSMNKKMLGESFTETRKAYQSVFPESMPEHSRQIADILERECYGVKPNGAGGGGYFVCVIEKPIDGGIPIKIR